MNQEIISEVIPDYSDEITNEEKNLTELQEQGYQYILKAFGESEELQKLYFYFERENYWEFLRAYKSNPIGKTGLFLSFILKIHTNDRVREALGAGNPLSQSNQSKRAYDVTSEENRAILSQILEEEKDKKQNNKLKLNTKTISKTTDQKEEIHLPQELLSEEERTEEQGMFAGMTEMMELQKTQKTKLSSNKGQKPREKQSNNSQEEQGLVYIEEEEADLLRDVEKMAQEVKKQKEKNALGYENINPKLFTNPNLFEGITPLFDLEQIRRYKEKGFQMLIFGNLVFLVSTIICLISAVYLSLSRDTELVVLTFHEPTQTFVSLPRIDKDFKPREELKKNLLSAYVYDRETINRFDEKNRDGIIKSQSTGDVWSVYSQIRNQDNSIYKSARDPQSQTYRKIEIISVQLLDQNDTGVVTFRASLREGLRTIYVKDYTATIKYGFVAQKNIKPDEIRNNPLGFMVYRYDLEALRELQNPQDIIVQDGVSYVKVYSKEDPSGEEIKKDYQERGKIPKEAKPNQEKGDSKELKPSLIGNNKKSNTGGSQ